MRYAPLSTSMSRLASSSNCYVFHSMNSFSLFPLSAWKFLQQPNAESVTKCARSKFRRLREINLNESPNARSMDAVSRKPIALRADFFFFFFCNSSRLVRAFAQVDEIKSAAMPQTDSDHSCYQAADKNLYLEFEMIYYRSLKERGWISKIIILSFSRFAFEQCCALLPSGNSLDKYWRSYMQGKYPRRVFVEINRVRSDLFFANLSEIRSSSLKAKLMKCHWNSDKMPLFIGSTKCGYCRRKSLVLLCIGRKVD